MLNARRQGQITIRDFDPLQPCARKTNNFLTLDRKGRLPMVILKITDKHKHSKSYFFDSTSAF